MRRDVFIADLVSAIEQDSLGDAICFDEMEARICVCGVLPWNEDGKPEFRPWGSMDDSHGYAHAQNIFGEVSEKTFQHALAIVADRRRYNAVANMLDSLPLWDGQKRVGYLMHIFLGASDDCYTKEVEELFMRAAIARALEPGCKFDYMPILTGQQGIGKSTFLRMLAMDPRFFIDNVFGIGTKQAAELVQGKWIVELPELAAMKKAALEAVKAFVTRQVDEYRAPYAKHAESRPRRFVMAGTTNASSFLADTTGNRRFLPIVCGATKPEMSLFGSKAKPFIAQSWAEAYADYKTARKSLVLSSDAAYIAYGMQEESSIDDPRIGLIGEWIETLEPGTLICTVQVIENALQITRDRQSRREQMEVSNLLQDSVDGIELLPGKHRVGEYGVQRAFMVKR